MMLFTNVHLFLPFFPFLGWKFRFLIFCWNRSISYRSMGYYILRAWNSGRSLVCFVCKSDCEQRQIDSEHLFGIKIIFHRLSYAMNTPTSIHS